jgi:hypothetical protein
MNKTEELFHELWTKAVGTEGYDKSRWKELQSFLERMMSEKTKTIHAHIELRGACCDSFEDAMNSGHIRCWLVPNAMNFVLDGKQISFCPYCGMGLKVEMPKIVKFAEKVTSGA